MKRSSVFAAAVLFIGLGAVAGGLALYKYREVAAAAAAGGGYEPAEAVGIVAAREELWQPTSDLVGTVIARRSVLVRNELEGRVTAVGFDSGSIVEEGQTVLTQDDTTERADLEGARASVRVAEANVGQADSRIRLAEQMRERLRSVEVRAIAEADVDRADSELSTAQAERLRWEAEVDQANARVAQLGARLAKMTITAPFRARAGMRVVHEGQYLPEGAEVVWLQELTESIYLDFAIPQEYAPRVKAGTAVMATGDLLGPEPVRIEVVATDAIVNNDTRNLRVRAVVENSAGTLVPGMFVQIRVPVEEPRPYVVVPGTAVRRASYADSVFVVVPGKGDGELRASQRFVKLGPAIGSDVIVLEGVEVGERVVATGSFKLRDGGLLTEGKSSAPPGPSPEKPAPTDHETRGE
ncbi:MAG: efflux RND transporter periplasmic adaptor subunit [Phycisphaerales bacterium]|nr:efflux RND transporter periplasmic adaptor subunit [Phycisphaerales bacterium]